MSDEPKPVGNDPITPIEAVQWNAWRLAQAFVVREALELCSTILRSVDPLVKELGYRSKDDDVLRPAWDLIDLGRRISDREMSSWLASALGVAAIGANGTDIAALLLHVQSASWILFNETVEKYVAWERKGPSSTWLGEPVMRALKIVVEAGRANASIENLLTNVAQGAHSEGPGDVASDIRRHIEEACGKPWPEDGGG